MSKRSMMGIHQPQPELFSYRVNLEKRGRPDHPLRRVSRVVDFGFVREEVAERLFVRTVERCVAAGLAGGDKLPVDASLIAANASKDAMLKSCPELIAAYKAADAVAEEKLDEAPRSRPNYEAVNDRVVSTSDPDASLVRKGSGGAARPVTIIAQWMTRTESLLP